MICLDLIWLMLTDKSTLGQKCYSSPGFFCYDKYYDLMKQRGFGRLFDGTAVGREETSFFFLKKLEL